MIQSRLSDVTPILESILEDGCEKGKNDKNERKNEQTNKRKKEQMNIRTYEGTKWTKKNRKNRLGLTLKDFRFKSIVCK
jgi:hypothetical protein